MVIERKGGRTFSLRALLRANFVFLFSKFSSVLSSLHTDPPLLLVFFSIFPSMVVFACLLVTTDCCCLVDVDTERMRFLEDQILHVVSAPGFF